MSPEVLIRPATAADIEAACEIAVRAWEPIFTEFRRRLGEDIFRQLYHDWADNKREQIRQAFAQHPDCLWVTVVEGQIAGFITAFVINAPRKLGEIGNNAVDPAFQGRGLARRQYEWVFAELRRRGCDLVQVTTGLDEAHAPARKAYEAVGFEHALPKVTYLKRL